MSKRYLFAGIAMCAVSSFAFAQEAEEPIVKPPAAEQSGSGQQKGTTETQQPSQNENDASSDKTKNQAEADSTEQPVKRKKDAQSDDDQKATDEGKTDTKAEKSKAEGTKQAEESKKKVDETTTGSTSKASTKITSENKTVIKNKIANKNVTRVDRNSIDFNISVGVAVPRTVHLVALPSTVIEIVPEYEGYLYFVLDDGTIVIVAPDTMEIVYVIA